MTSDILVLKVKYKEELRRIAIPFQDLDCNVLRQKIAVMFPDLNNDFTCYYDNGDTELLELKETYLQWLQYANFDGKYPLLRILVKDNQEIENIQQEEVDEEFKEEEDEKEAEDELMLPSEDICTNCAIAICYLTNEIRYKCLMCRGVLLCNSCAHPPCGIAPHPADHLLVELRTPIKELNLLQKLILLRNVEESDRVTAKKLKKIRRKLRKEIKKENDKLKKDKKKKKQKKRDRKLKKKENDNDNDNDYNNNEVEDIIDLTVRSEEEIKEILEENKIPTEGDSMEDMKNAIEEFYSSEAFYLEDIENQHVAKLYAYVVDNKVPCAGDTKDHYIEAIRNHLETAAAEAEEEEEGEGEEKENNNDDKIDESPIFNEEEKENSELNINNEMEKVEDEELKSEKEENEGELVTIFQNVSDKFTKWWNTPKENVKFSSNDLVFNEKLNALEGMGFNDKNMNRWLLIKHLGNLEAVVAELAK